MLFNNKTKDETKQLQQVQQLVDLVNMVTSKNNGQPYTNKTFVKSQVKKLYIVKTFPKFYHTMLPMFIYILCNVDKHQSKYDISVFGF